MTLSGVIALILRFLPNLIALLAKYVLFVEYRPILSVNICLPVQSSTFAITNPPCSAVSLRELSYLFHFQQ